MTKVYGNTFLMFGMNSCFSEVPKPYGWGLMQSQCEFTKAIDRFGREYLVANYQGTFVAHPQINTIKDRPCHEVRLGIDLKTESFLDDEQIEALKK